MGSPLGPLLADVFLGKIESSKISAIITKCILYKRYVDDIFCVVDERLNPQEILSTVNSAHNNLNFTCELENNSEIPFLDVKITRLADGAHQREVHRKPTWNDQYIHFDSFVPRQQKLNLIHCLVRRAKDICTPDTIENELAFVKQIFLKNGYPEQLVQKTINSVKDRTKQIRVTKKPTYISLPFKGDSVAKIISRRLTKGVEETYYAAKLFIHFSSTRLGTSQLKDKLPCSTTSFCVYSFKCSCGTSYIGRTTRRLSERVREHHPVWLSNGQTRKTNYSAILNHLIEFNHSVDIKSSFRIVFRIPNHKSRPVKCRLLAISEAICIRLCNPELCSQKHFVRTLTLPWPSIKSTGLSKLKSTPPQSMLPIC